MKSELVSGWSDDRFVYLVFRKGEQVSYRKFRGRWSFFVRGLDDDDRSALQRLPDVIALTPDKDPEIWRVDVRTRWARMELARKVSTAVSNNAMIDALFEEDAEAGALNAAVLEADVNPLRRFLSDTPTITIGRPRLGYFDLEVDSRQSFGQQIEGKARILSWVLVAENGDVLGAEVLDEDTDAAERAMLERMFVAMEAVDCILAWYGSGYDFPLLEKRMQRLKVRVRGVPPLLNRWTWLDHLEVFQKYNQAHKSGEERASFKLNDVAQHLLDEGKDAFDASKTWEAWVAGGDERARLLRYNIQDTKLLQRIEAKTSYIELHLTVCRVTRCFPDTDSLGAAMQGDGFMLALGAERGYRFPTKRVLEEGEASGQFAGAFVMEPLRTGILDGVHVADFAGLYPSIIRSWNMSPDTYVMPRDHERVGRDACRLPGRDVRFRTGTRGLFPIALDHLVTQREEYKRRAKVAAMDSEEWRTAQHLSAAFKVVANSFYGIIGSPFTRFFDSVIAEGVTQTGVWLNKHVMKVAEQAGLEPIYGDTDSVFVQGSSDQFERVIETLNESWPGALKDLGTTQSFIKLSFEKTFKRIVLVSKKRYAGRFEKYEGKIAPPDMKPEIKGLEYKRGDTLRFAREMQEQAITMLLQDGDPPTLSTMREFVGEWRAKVLTGELTVEDVMMSQSVKSLSEYSHRYTSVKCTTRVAKTACGYNFGTTDIGKEKEPTKCPKCKMPRKQASLPAHVRVAMLMRARGEQVRSGTRVEYLVVKGEDNADDDKLQAVPAHDPGVMERIDREYYWDRRVLPPTARLLEAAYPGTEWAETAGKRRKAEKAQAKAMAIEANRGKINDLPLFGAPSDRSDTTPAPPRTRQDEPAAQPPAVEGEDDAGDSGRVLDPTAPLFATPRAKRRGPRAEVMRPRAEKEGSDGSR